MPERKPIGGKKVKRAASPRAAPQSTKAEVKPGRRLEPLGIADTNPLVRKAEYAVRGRLLERSKELEAQMREGAALPFKRIVRCNIGNPQALGQRPMTFVRQTLSLLMNPALIEAPEIAVLYPADVIERAQAYTAAVPSAGAYSDSQGVLLVRQEVAAFISERDGVEAKPEDIFLTDGASAGVKMMLQLLIRGPQDGVITPVPQYPLYSASVAMLNGTLAPYYLNEDEAWGVSDDELRAALQRAREAGASPRAIVVINPGNPTGQSLPRDAIRRILAFAAAEHLVIMADEVYQENVYGDAPPFTSFRRALAELRTEGEAGDEAAAAAAAAVQLVSFHSTSKGFSGECGLRGGYFELQGFSEEVKGELVKLASVCLCSNLVGQFTTGLMVRPPRPGDASHAQWAAERQAILDSLYSRARRIASALNQLEGFRCNAAEGAMYLFPSVALPPDAIAAAEAAATAPDEFYCLALLEATGLVVVPGSGFRQVEGTWHFRTTFLPPAEMLDEVLELIASFHQGFLAKYGGAAAAAGGAPAPAAVPADRAVVASDKPLTDGAAVPVEAEEACAA